MPPEPKKSQLAIDHLSYEHFQFLIEAAPVGVVISDRQQNTLYVNQKFTDMYGYTIDDIPSINEWWPLAYPDSADRELVCREWDKAYKEAVENNQEIGPIEYYVTCKDGARRDTEFRLALLTELSIILFTDITERRKAEQELKESEEKFRALAENSPVAIMIYQDDYFVYTNPAGQYISGYSKEELYRMRFWELIHPDYREMVRSRGKMRQSGKQAPQRYDFKIITKEGKEKWVNLTGATTRFRGKPAAFISVIDITEQKEGVQALQFQLKFEKLVADVSATLVSVTPEQLDEKIGQVLKLCGEFIQADRSYIFHMSDDGTSVEQVYEWCAEGIDSPKELLEGMDTSSRPWWTRKLLEEGTVYIHDLDSMPEEAFRERQFFQQQNLKSVLAVAVKREEKLRRVLTFGAVRDKQEWTKEQIALLRVIAEIISNAISRQRAEKALQDSEQKYREILATMEEGYYEVDLTGNFTFFNNSLCSLVGYFPGELMGNNYRFLYKDPRKVYDPFNRVYKTGRPEKAANIPIKRGDGQEIFVEVSITLRRDDEGKPIGFCGVVRDITDRKEAEKELEEAHRRLAEIIEFLPDATFVIDNEGIVIAWNRAIEEMAGVSKDNMIGKSNYEYAVPLYGKRRHLLIDLVRSPDQQLYKQYSYINREGDTLYGEAYADNLYGGKGAYLWGAASVLYDTSGNPVGAIETIRDITDRKIYEDKLKYLSLHDQLTGLYNRAYFDNELNRLNESREYPITVIVCDLDGLKLINDTLGHDSGDQLLVACGSLLKQCLRASDILARVGGDEFVAILPNTGIKSGKVIGKRIMDKVNEYNGDNFHLPLSISLGTATLESPEQTLWETYKEADDLMYRAKLHKGAGAKSQIIKSLMAALGERDFITEGHASRLEELCRKVGEKISLSNKQLSDLTLLAQVHDLGKVGIPDQILFKEGPLNKEEWKIMRTHPEKGHRIAAASTDLHDIADLILHHHECWDGSGYPAGLKGKAIPVECRILAIVDAFDAMISDRPYRKALKKEEVVAEIKKNAGTQFDPHLVEIFLKII